MKKLTTYFTRGELMLWGVSSALILISFLIFDRVNTMTLAASLIVLWSMAAIDNISYLSVIICFVMFLVNDLYGFVSWKRMERRQMAAA